MTSTKIGYIYCHTNKINGKMYIGKTVQKLERRFRKTDSTYKNYKSCTVFYKALLKYGWDNFETTILKICSLDEIKIYEELYIKQYNTIAPNGYNTVAIDNGLNVYSEKSRKKISKKKKEWHKHNKFIPHNKVHHVTVNGIISKECTKCKTVVPLTGFGKYKTTWDGYTPHCTNCRVAQYRSKYKVNLNRYKIRAVFHDGTDVVYNSKEEAKQQLGTRNKSILEAIRTGKEYFGAYWYSLAGA